MRVFFIIRKSFPAHIANFFFLLIRNYTLQL
jgi:hypothetical protein